MTTEQLQARDLRLKKLLAEAIMDLVNDRDVWPQITPPDVRACLTEVWDAVQDE